MCSIRDFGFDKAGNCSRPDSDFTLKDTRLPTNEHPSCAFALAARFTSLPTCSFACGTLGPVKISDSSLNTSFAAFAPAMPMLGQRNVVSGRSTDGANREWFKAYHGQLCARFYSADLLFCDIFCAMNSKSLKSLALVRRSNLRNFSSVRPSRPVLPQPAATFSGSTAGVVSPS